jgi:hypothetical protein
MHNLTISGEEYSGHDQIRVGNGTGLNISHIGSAFPPSSCRTFLLQQLLHVPNICKNLLSASKFAKDNSIFF